MRLQTLAGGQVHMVQAEVVGPDGGQMLQDLGGVAFRKEHAVHHIMLKDQVAVARHVDIHDLDVRLPPADVILPGKRAPHLPIAPLIVDRVPAERRISLILEGMAQPPVPARWWYEEMNDEPFVQVKGTHMLENITMSFRAGQDGENIKKQN